MVDDVELGGELGAVRIGWGFGNGMAQRLQVIEFARRRGQSCVDAGDGAPVGLVVAMRVAVG